MNLAFVIDFVVEMSSAQMVDENHILRFLKLQEKNISIKQSTISGNENIRQLFLLRKISFYITPRCMVCIKVHCTMLLAFTLRTSM